MQGSPARASYDFHVSGFDTQDPASASSVLKFSTSAQSGLGDQLPEGTVRVYMKDASGSPQFIGESEIDATPMGSDLSIVTGDAFDVNVRTVVEARDQRGDNHWRTTMRYELTNASARAITVELTQDGLYGEARVIEESLESDRVSADSVRWQVPVPANGSTTVSATFDTRY